MSSPPQQQTSILGSLSSLAWPIVVVLGGIVFAGPIREILVHIPKALVRATTVEVSGLKFSLSPEVPAPTPDIATALRGISGDDLTELFSMNINGRTTVGIGAEAVNARHQNLIQRGLVRWADRSEPTAYFQITDLGRRSRDYLLSVLSFQLQGGR
jgi:hypothetical protein